MKQGRRDQRDKRKKDVVRLEDLAPRQDVQGGGKKLRLGERPAGRRRPEKQ